MYYNVYNNRFYKKTPAAWSTASTTSSNAFPGSEDETCAQLATTGLSRSTAKQEYETRQSAKNQSISGWFRYDTNTCRPGYSLLKEPIGIAGP